MCFLPLLRWIFFFFFTPAYFSFRFTSVKSNPLQPCNAVTLLDFPFYWRKTMEQDLGLQINPGHQSPWKYIHCKKSRMRNLVELNNLFLIDLLQIYKFYSFKLIKLKISSIYFHHTYRTWVLLTQSLLTWMNVLYRVQWNMISIFQTSQHALLESRNLDLRPIFFLV